MMPGPREPTRRPRRNTTARSYSRSTLSPLKTNRITMRTAANAPGMAPPSPAPRGDPPHAEPEALDAGHLDRLPVVDHPVGLGAPVFPADDDGSRRREAPARDADRAEHPVRPDRGPRALRA